MYADTSYFEMNTYFPTKALPPDVVLLFDVPVGKVCTIITCDNGELIDVIVTKGENTTKKFITTDPLRTKELIGGGHRVGKEIAFGSLQRAIKVRDPKTTTELKYAT